MSESSGPSHILSAFWQQKAKSKREAEEAILILQLFFMAKTWPAHHYKIMDILENMWYNTTVKIRTLEIHHYA